VLATLASAVPFVDTMYTMIAETNVYSYFRLFVDWMLLDGFVARYPVVVLVTSFRSPTFLLPVVFYK